MTAIGTVTRPGPRGCLCVDISSDTNNKNTAIAFF